MSGVDQDIAVMLGRIEGELGALRRAFEDERDIRRADSRKMLEKFDEIEHLHNLVEIVQGKLESVKSQVYSTKSELEIMKSAIIGQEKLILKTRQIYIRLLGIGTIVFGMSGALVSFIIMMIINWGTIVPFLRTLLKA